MQSYCETHPSATEGLQGNPWLTKVTRPPSLKPHCPLTILQMASIQECWFIRAELNSVLGWLFLASCLEGKKKNVKRKKRKQIFIVFCYRPHFSIYNISSQPTTTLGASHLNPTLCAWTWETGMLSPGLRSCSWLMAEGSFEPRTL